MDIKQSSTFLSLCYFRIQHPLTIGENYNKQITITTNKVKQTITIKFIQRGQDNHGITKVITLPIINDSVLLISH